jgi:hypothetical protein
MSSGQLNPYQLDLTTPGIMPSLANSRKQIRHSRNRRMYPLGRPQREQRLRTRVGYLRLVSRTIILVFATSPPYLTTTSRPLNGMPKSRSKWKPPSSVWAVVTMVISIPRILSILS